MFHFLVLLSLLTSNAYRVVAVTLDASLLTKLGYNTQSYGIYVDRENITDIDPNAFKGYTQVNYLGLQMNLISKLDLEVFKELVNLRQVFLSYNPLTQLTNAKKITFPQITSFYLNDCQLKSVDTDVINGLPNLMYFDVERCYLTDPLKPNQFSAWKKLDSLTITTKNQVTLNKTHLNGINSLSAFAFTYSNIKTVQVETFLSLPNVTAIDLSYNALTSIEYLKIPSNVYYLNLEGNKLNTFKLSTTSSVIQSLNLNNNQFKSFKSMDFSLSKNLNALTLSNNPHSSPNQIFTELKSLTSLRLIELNNLSISTLDPNFFKRNTNLDKVYLTHNKISVLPYNTFSSSKNLAILDLSYNQIIAVDSRTFKGLDDLSFLNLQNNKLAKISSTTFSNINQLNYLDLSNNLITEIGSSAFLGCDRLRDLNLKSNRLTKLSPKTFDTLYLFTLVISHNKITELDSSTFDGLTSVSDLDLSFNSISKIGSGTFSNTRIYQSIDLSNNRLTKLDKETFIGQNMLLKIDLTNNSISTIDSNAFSGLGYLQNIYLNGNNLTQLDNSLFSGFSNLQGIYLYDNPKLSKTNLQSLCPTASTNCKIYY